MVLEVPWVCAKGEAGVAKEIGIGIIGGGYMGKAHAVAMAAVGAVFNTGLRPRLEMVAATSQDSAARYRDAYGFARATDDWRVLVADPRVEAVIIASVQATHLDIAKAAFALGKPVMCEKPMGLNAAEARQMAAAAQAAGVANMVAYNYVRTPATQAARKMIAGGALGRVHYIRAEHVEDFQNDPASFAAWRCSGEANGCLGDLAPHIINAARALMGPIASLSAVMETIHDTRGPHTVTNDDQMQAMVRFESGAMGHLFASRIATGRKMGYAYEVTGDKGSLRFDQEDQNSLWFYDTADPKDRAGFRRILTGPEHPDYLPFCQGPGHGTGYQDQIIIEARDFLTAIETGAAVYPTFAEGVEVQRTVAAIRASHAAQGWVNLRDF